MRIGATKVFDNKIKAHSVFNISDEYTAKDKIEIPLKKNMKVTATCKTNLKELFNTPFTAVKGIGMTVDYKL